MNSLDMVFIGLLVIAFILALIVFFDKGLKWKDKD